MNVQSKPWLVLASIALLGWLVYLLAPVITPFAIAAGLAYLGDPLADRLEHWTIRGWTLGRTLAVVLVFLLMTLILALSLVFLVPLLIDQVELMVAKLPGFAEWVTTTAWPSLAGFMGVDPGILKLSQLTQWVQGYWRELGGAAFTVAGSLGRGGQALLQWLTNLVLVPVVTFYMLRDWDLMVLGVRNLLPRSSLNRVSQIASEIDTVLGAFLRGQLVVMLALGIIYSLGLWLVDIEFAFLIGMGAGLLSIVPYLGSIIGLAVAGAAALVQHHDVLHLALVLGVFMIGQTAEGMVLTPKLVGDQIGLHPVAVIFAVLAGGQLFGFLGILLALPAAAALNVLVRHADEFYRDSDVYKE